VAAYRRRVFTKSNRHVPLKDYEFDEYASNNTNVELVLPTSPKNLSVTCGNHPSFCG
jgi:hypothetical protein